MQFHVSNDSFSVLDIYRKTPLGHRAVLEGQLLPEPARRLLWRSNGFTPAALLFDVNSEASDVRAAAQLLLQRRLIERVEA